MQLIGETELLQPLQRISSTHPARAAWLPSQPLDLKMTKRYPSVVLATCCIPWRPDFTLDTVLFQRCVRQLVEEMTPHVYIFGTAGEGHAVTDAQFQEIVTAFREALPSHAQPMVGIISNSLGTVVERIEFGRTQGFRDFQISFPSWGALNDVEIEAFFEATCGRFSDCRFLHYNLPRTKRMLAGADYARLVARHPNLVAMKMGSPDNSKLEDILQAAPELQCFFVEFGYAAMRDNYECGYIPALAGGKPVWANRYFKARGAELQAMAEEAQAAREVLHAHVHAADAHMDGAYDKLHLRMLVPEFPLRLLPPYSATAEADWSKLVDALPEGWMSP